MQNKNKSNNTIIKDAIALFGITLVAGLLLGWVYQTTKDPITQSELKAKQEAYQAVFTDASEFEEDAVLAKAVTESGSFFEENGITGAELTEALLAKNDNGDVIGYVMSVTGTEGYAGDIKFTIGIDKDGMVTGLEVLSMNETAGLGAKCKEDEFKNQYVGINADEVILTKTGKQEDNEIDAISGATITSNAVTKAVNAGIAFVKKDLAEN